MACFPVCPVHWAVRPSIHVWKPFIQYDSDEMRWARVVSGTEGYIYVPAPWWKTDYFEIRYENPANNKRYFYQLDGEGIRYEIVAFLKSIEDGRDNSYVGRGVSKAIAGVVEDFYRKKDVREI